MCWETWGPKSWRQPQVPRCCLRGVPRLCHPGAVPLHARRLARRAGGLLSAQSPPHMAVPPHPIGEGAGNRGSTHMGSRAWSRGTRRCPSLSHPGVERSCPSGVGQHPAPLGWLWEAPTLSAWAGQDSELVTRCPTCPRAVGAGAEPQETWPQAQAGSNGAACQQMVLSPGERGPLKKKVRVRRKSSHVK